MGLQAGRRWPLSVAPLSDPRPEAKPRTNATVFEGHASSPEAQGFKNSMPVPSPRVGRENFNRDKRK